MRPNRIKSINDIENSENTDIIFLHEGKIPDFSLASKKFLGKHKLGQPISMRSKCMLIGSSMASNPESDKARSRVEIVATEIDEENHGSAIITFLHSGMMLTKMIKIF